MRAFTIALIPGLLLVGGELAAGPPGPTPLKVVGGRLRSVDGKAVRLRGVNVPSLEWGQGEHVFDSLRVAIEEWGANVIRLPLSRDRWFGLTRERKDEGADYRKTVHELVDQAAAKGCYVILDLHWYGDARWGEESGRQHKMPDDSSIGFWEAVANAFANHPAVLFNLYNEPHDVSWEVWRNGGMVTEEDKNVPGGKLEYHTPGLQKLVEVCRSTGARNLIVAGGLDWAYDLTGIAKGYALSDPNGNGVIYDSHIYPMKKWYTHGTEKSQEWDRVVMSGGEKYPVMIGEFGDGEDGYANKVLEFADKYDLSWVAWCLHPGAKPCLIKDWKYAPTPFGEEVKKALHKTSAKP
jgi:hypothetical protein